MRQRFFTGGQASGPLSPAAQVILYPCSAQAGLGLEMGGGLKRLRGFCAQEQVIIHGAHFRSIGVIKQIGSWRNKQSHDSRGTWLPFSIRADADWFDSVFRGTIIALNTWVSRPLFNIWAFCLILLLLIESFPCSCIDTCTSALFWTKQL